MINATRLAKASLSELQYEYYQLHDQLKSIKSDTYHWAGFTILTAGLSMSFVVTGLLQINQLSRQIKQIEHAATHYHGVEDLRNYQTNLTFGY